MSFNVANEIFKGAGVAYDNFTVESNPSADNRAIKRPGITPIFILACLMWISCAISYQAIRGFDIESYILVIVSVLVISIVICFIVVLKNEKTRIFAICIGFVLIGVLCASIGAYSTLASKSMAKDGVNVTLELLEDSKTQKLGSSALCRLTTDNGRSSKCIAYFNDNEIRLVGDTLEGTTDIKVLDDDILDMYWSRGVALKVSANSFNLIENADLIEVFRCARRSAIEGFLNSSDGQGNILAALSCGYKRGIEEDGTYENFKTCGLAHVVAVSGAHLAIVASVVALVLSALCANRYITVTVTVLFSLVYLVFSGLPISAMRSALMVILSLSAFVFKRRGASLNSLAICIIAFLAIDPCASLSVSLFLSAGATAGILIFSGLFASWFERLPKFMQKPVVNPLGMTMAASLPTQPFSAALFGQFPLIAPISNIAIAPIFTISCIAALLSAIVIVLVPDLADATIWLASIICMPMNGLTSFLSNIPHACIAVSASPIVMLAVSLSLCLVLWLVWPKATIKSAAIVLIVIIIASVFIGFITRISASDELRFFDVGQGDATLIRSEGQTVLIDTGNQDSLLKTAIAKAGVTDIDTVFITHPDDDHCGSIESLSTYVHIEQIIVAKGLLNCNCDKCENLVTTANDIVGKNKVISIEVGDIVTVGKFSLHVLWPDRFEDQGGNGDSLVMLACADCDQDGVDDWSTLLTGDAENEQLSEIVKQNDIYDIDVLKVGHHGSKVSLSKDLANRLLPEISLIGVGKNNRYGHPSDECLDDLNVINSNIFRTDECGTITLIYDNFSIKVNVEKGG